MLELSATEAIVDVKDAAEYAGLTYVSDERPGIRRRRSGKGFRYESDCGQHIKDAVTLERIKALAVPPAWTDVWICAKANGHVQATGRDARGRKQYRYHARFREVRESTTIACWHRGQGTGHSAFSRARNERFRDSDILRCVFERVVETCIAAGLVGGQGFAVDASLIVVDANKQRSIPGKD